MRGATGEILAGVGRASRALWFIDFDGTLVGLARRPELVSLRSEARDALAALSRRGDSRVAVVSGRPLPYIRRQVGLRRVVCAGNHGLEIAGPSLRFRHPEAVAARPALREVKRGWERASRDFAGSLVEDKTLSVTFHYRQVEARKQGDARAAALSSASAPLSRGHVRVTEGKKVVEVRPSVAWGKGEALAFLLEHWGYAAGRDAVVAIGDDETDRDMFRVLDGKGIAVFVGKGAPPPEATLRLTGPEAVRRLILEAARRP